MRYTLDLEVDHPSCISIDTSDFDENDTFLDILQDIQFYADEKVADNLSVFVDNIKETAKKIYEELQENKKVD